MKYIQFKQLQIKNFLSVGDKPVTIQFNRGLNIITGVNRDKEDRRNGVGKSTIADAIYFAVFGNTIRELKKEHITNNVTQDRCEICLEFDVTDNNNCTQYKIVRTLAPTKCFLYVNDNDETRDSISNTNELISDIINSSPEVFQNCVIMTINNTTPFMAKKKIEKRKFIEGIFNLQVFSSMLNAARTESNEVNKDFQIECTRYEETSNTLQSHVQQKEEMNQHRKNSEQKFRERKEMNDKKIEELKKAARSLKLIDEEETEKTIKKLNDARDQIKTEIENQQKKCIKLGADIDIINERVEKLGTEESECPVCLRKMSEHDHDHIVDEKKKMIKNRDKLLEQKEKCDRIKFEKDNKLELIRSAIKKTDASLYKNKLNKQEILNIQNNITHLKELNNQIEDDVSHMHTDTKLLDKHIQQVSDKLDEVQRQIDVLKKQSTIYDVVKFIVSEEGVKSYIVKKILQLFNSKLAYYLKKMDANCICVFNEYFEEQIIDEKGKICSYFNFSGAERKNIDLACLFAFMDIRRLQGDAAFNFSIYDELFDSSLDERGVDLVTEILKERVEKYNECIMVISHRKESTKSATGEIIFLEKRNGITSRIKPIDTIK